MKSPAEDSSRRCKMPAKMRFFRPLPASVRGCVQKCGRPETQNRWITGKPTVRRTGDGEVRAFFESGRDHAFEDW